MKRETSSHDLPFLGDFLVVGLGVSGTSVAEYALKLADEGRVTSVTVYSGESVFNEDDPLYRDLVERGARVMTGTEVVSGAYAIGVVSPGISVHSGFYSSAKAACDEFMSEPEFAWRESPDGWIAITGTNGKTTTTALAAHVLTECGIPARAVGNIGVTCITGVDERSGEVLVAELSSYQLESTSRFAPEVAMLLNITPDHLEWHGTHQSYANAKAKIFNNMDQDGLAIINEDDSEACKFIGPLNAQGLRVAEVSSVNPDYMPKGEDAAWNENGKLKVRLRGVDYELCPVRKLAIKGVHNVNNALCAAVAALEMGVDPEQLSTALTTFKPLAHRVELVGIVEGVEYINDSKATNTDATLKALTAFPDKNIVLMLGGKDKGTDLGEFAQECIARCSAIVCFGEAGSRFLEALVEVEGSDLVALAQADYLEDALEVATSLAETDSVVLLSPACASFDEFTNFEERGVYFKALVKALEKARE